MSRRAGSFIVEWRIVSRLGHCGLMFACKITIYGASAFKLLRSVPPDSTREIVRLEEMGDLIWPLLMLLSVTLFTAL
jgi:hypothetical protein